MTYNFNDEITAIVELYEEATARIKAALDDNNITYEEFCAISDDSDYVYGFFMDMWRQASQEKNWAVVHQCTLLSVRLAAIREPVTALCLEGC